jgi:hypothetical protein
MVLNLKKISEVSILQPAFLRRKKLQRYLAYTEA